MLELLARAYFSRSLFYRIITLKTEVEAYKNSSDKECPKCLNLVSRHRIIQPKTVAHALTFIVNIRDQIIWDKKWGYRSSDILSSFCCRVTPQLNLSSNYGSSRHEHLKMQVGTMKYEMSFRGVFPVMACTGRLCPEGYRFQVSGTYITG